MPGYSYSIRYLGEEQQVIRANSQSGAEQIARNIFDRDDLEVLRVPTIRQPANGSGEGRGCGKFEFDAFGGGKGQFKDDK